MEISWLADGRPEIKIKKQSEKWMHYERRPERPVEFLGLIRTLPAIELPVLRHHFREERNKRIYSFSSKEAEYISRVLEHPYKKVESVRSEKYSIRRLSEKRPYTSFDMGAGEDASITLIERLMSAPKGALIVIEELEATLHPAAQKELTKALLKLADERNLQIIGSTHSQHVLGALPSESRMLLAKNGSQHEVLVGPTVEQATSDLSGQPIPELLVICEDEFACCIVRNLLDAEFARRVQLVSGGSKSELADRVRNHLCFSDSGKGLVLWDADVPADEREGYRKKAEKRHPSESVDCRVTYGVLPGEGPPERWLLDALVRDEGREMSEMLGLGSSENALELLESAAVEQPHDRLKPIARYVARSTEDILALLATCIRKIDPESAAEINKLVKRALRG